MRQPLPCPCCHLTQASPVPRAASTSPRAGPHRPARPPAPPAARRPRVGRHSRRAGRARSSRCAVRQPVGSSCREHAGGPGWMLGSCQGGLPQPPVCPPTACAASRPPPRRPVARHPPADGCCPCRPEARSLVVSARLQCSGASCALSPELMLPLPLLLSPAAPGHTARPMARKGPAAPAWLGLGIRSRARAQTAARGMRAWPVLTFHASPLQKLPVPALPRGARPGPARCGMAPGAGVKPQPASPPARPNGGPARARACRSRRRPAGVAVAGLQACSLSSCALELAAGWMEDRRHTASACSAKTLNRICADEARVHWRRSRRVS